MVAAERLHRGEKLAIGEAWGRLGKDWTDQYEHDHSGQVNHCRQMRGLPIPEEAA